jgi:hypothetical protein
MSFIPTPKQAALLQRVRDAGEVQGVYALAKALGRPYKRVLENLRTLQAAGLVELSNERRSGRKTILVRRSRRRGRQPQLSYNRVWSSPVSGVDDTVLIASVLARPTFDDLLTCCRHYGLPRVRSVYMTMLGTGELDALVQQSVSRMLANIEIGFARAA